MKSNFNSLFNTLFEEILSDLNINNDFLVKTDIQQIGPITNITDAQQLLRKPEIQNIINQYNINELVDQTTQQVLQQENFINETIENNLLINKIYNQVLTKINNPQKFKTIFKNILLASILVVSSQFLTGCNKCNIKVPKKIEGIQNIKTPNVLDSKSPFSPLHPMNSNHPINWKY